MMALGFAFLCSIRTATVVGSVVCLRFLATISAGMGMHFIEGIVLGVRLTVRDEGALSLATTARRAGK